MVVFDDFLGVLVVLFCLCACVREYEPSRIRWVRLSTLDDVVMMCVDCYRMRLFSLRLFGFFHCHHWCERSHSRSGHTVMIFVMCILVLFF
ncbi:hypothetical protein I4F81_002645 [Pyropia yezoensis]|uniref:Uncharacterized protein n=1 Tax=Pyropia yezoensis TaxID=2788 RepID=A0ACC3BQ31_PYRYE|nr:hypothetical protein I4F81_002645 [Neopyropia yezoensis]